MLSKLFQVVESESSDKEKVSSTDSVIHDSCLSTFFRTSHDVDPLLLKSPPRSLLRWRPHKELCFDWSAGLSTGVFLSIRENVRPPSF